MVNNTVQPLRGIKDLLQDDYIIYKKITDTALEISMLYGYSQISTPILEYTKIFDRTLGTSSDVVSKEMYTFLDKSGDHVALRPEFTAGIIRSFISNGLQHKLPLKFFSHGPVFRYDRPQAGRQRQFHQINFEYIGASGSYCDAEVIKLAVDFLTSLNLIDKLTLEVNSIGCFQSRADYEQKLMSYFSRYKSDLSEDSIKRLDTKPLRILDSKALQDQEIIKNAPLINSAYTDDAKKYFDSVLSYLDLLNIEYVINPKLVRGLDYYCHTAFEFKTSLIGAQSAVLAGGRYDGLAKLMGAVNDVPAIGFAAGVERLMLLMEYDIPLKRMIHIMPLDESNLDRSLILADRLRQERSINLPIILDVVGKLNKRISRAVTNNAKYIVFIGAEEERQQYFTVKDLDKREETKLSLQDLINKLIC